MFCAAFELRGHTQGKIVEEPENMYWAWLRLGVGAKDAHEWERRRHIGYMMDLLQKAKIIPGNIDSLYDSLMYEIEKYQDTIKGKPIETG